MRASGLIDMSIGDLDDMAVELKRADIGDLETGDHLEGHRVGKIALTRKDFFDFVLVFGQRHIGLVGRLEVAFLNKLLAGLIELLLNDLGHDRLAVDAAQMRYRHLAGPEALEIGAAGELGELLVELAVEIGGPDDDLEFALQTFAQRFGDLHNVLDIPKG